MTTATDSRQETAEVEPAPKRRPRIGLVPLFGILLLLLGIVLEIVALVRQYAPPQVAPSSGISSWGGFQSLGSSTLGPGPFDGPLSFGWLGVAALAVGLLLVAAGLATRALRRRG